MRGIISLFVLLCVAGCASPPSTYYSLADLSASTRVLPPRGGVDYGLNISQVLVPAEVDRPQLVIRRDAQGADLVLLNESLWAAPLSDQIRSALGAQLASALDVPDLSLMDPPAGLKLRELGMRVTRFDLVFGQYAALALNWSEGSAGKSERLCQVAVKVPVDSGVSALVEGQRTALQWTAQVIAARMKADLPAPDDPVILRNTCT
ncbi:MAG TPA: ABC-type transport auxiliary lipoprotein family protein [Castellaniella sp.]|nr:ABC-type transport auxiliary lipoprotein family protein [Castellaniella sp.]